ncbi:C-X-C motif chemokine 10-like [Polymixia lowei]
MKLYLQSVCQLAALSICCVLITARTSGSTYIPGRCSCLEMQDGVKGQLKDLRISPKSPSCDRYTVIVIKHNDQQVCLNPNAPMGKQLIRCWKSANKAGRDVRLCLKRMKKGKQRQHSRQRNRGQNRRPTS